MTKQIKNPSHRFLLVLSILFLINGCTSFFYGEEEDKPADQNICSASSGCHCPTPPYNLDEMDAIANCSYAGISNVINEIEIPGGILKIDFSHNKIREISGKAFQSPNSDVIHLDFSFNGIKELSAGLFGSFKNLKDLDLQKNEIVTLDKSTFEGLANLLKLDLSFNNLTTLPLGLFEPLTNLKQLQIGHNPITTLQSKLFDGINQLQFLSLAGLQIETIDASLFRNTQLQVLDLSDNRLKEVPTKALKVITDTLTSLSLSNNPIQILNETSFTELRNLKSIYLNHLFHLEQIGPFTFEGMENLNSVYLKKLPKLKEIDPQAFYLHRESRVKCPITELTIQDTSLTTLDKGLLFWKNIIIFELKNNDWNCDCKMGWLIDRDVLIDLKGDFICTQPEKFNGKDLRDLNSRTLECSKRPVIPEEVLPGDTWDICKSTSSCRCPQLAEDDITVDCSESHITYINDHMYISPIYKAVDFSQNSIQSLSTETFAGDEPEIEELNLSSNVLEGLLSGTFRKLANLKHLDLYNNKLYNLHQSSFSGLGNLTFLDLHFNDIAHLPDNLFDPLVSLQELNLGYNDFISIDKRLFSNLKNLKSLDLSFLKLKTLHYDTFANLRLTSLNLNHNLFSEVPVKALQNVKSTLKTLIISANRMTSLDHESFHGLAELHEIQMKQMLQLKEIGPYTFRGLHRLETIVLMYIPKIKTIDKMAFHLEEGGSQYCPIKDFTLAFTQIDTLDEELLLWDDLDYLDLKNNRWNCDCRLAWIKGSIVEALVGKELYCAVPLRLRLSVLNDIEMKDMNCNHDLDKHTNLSLGLIIGLMLLGITASLSTVAYLTYKRNGFLFRRPKGQSQYNRLNEEMTTITVEG